MYVNKRGYSEKLKKKRKKQSLIGARHLNQAVLQTNWRGWGGCIQDEEEIKQ